MNMKPPSKPISSPGRTEKFPPPLMRFLRTNVSSRSQSRGRSRSSPMFVRKNKNSAAIDSQEPSSPKVTCIGQVRVRRSSKHHHHHHSAAGDTPTRRRWWLRHGLSCRRFNFHCHCQPLWPNCGFFRILKRTKVTQHSSATQLNLRDRFNVEEETTPHVGYEFDEEEEEEEGFQERPNSNLNEDVHVPPKNALLLTRCRSAPYRSSSLASRFWGSPLNNSSSEETEEGNKTEMQNGEHENPNSSLQQIESVSADTEGRLDSREEEEACGFFKELEDSMRERIIKSENAGDLNREDGGGDSSRPLILTRCKSEPARTAHKLDPDFNFWKKRRLGLPDSCSPHYL